MATTQDTLSTIDCEAVSAHLAREFQTRRQHGTPLSIDRNGLRCRWAMIDGRLQAVWDVR